MTLAAELPSRWTSWGTTARVHPNTLKGLAPGEAVVLYRPHHSARRVRVLA
jgi:hypothetical protein